MKLLYDNDSTVPRPLSRLPAEAVKAITERVLEEERWPEERGSKLLDVVLAMHQQPDCLGLALSRTGLTGWEAILDKIRRRANSTAVERFNRESRVSGIIRADQLSRSTQAQISGTVDIIGSTQRFKSYPAYDHLKNELAGMGVSVSDYALVMDRYEFSMKDLLECGPGQSDGSGHRYSELREGRRSHRAHGDHAGPRRSGSEVDAQHGLAPEARQRCRRASRRRPRYELLKRMTFEDRIRTALPFLRDIVVGLSRLHRVSYRNGGPLFHLDIKPANIYIRQDDTKGVVCALGDLGFLPPEPGLDRTTEQRSTSCRSARSITGRRTEGAL